VLISPTSPFVAFGLGDKVADPMAMYLNDLCTLPASLAGSPAISVPCGLSTDAGPRLPVGLQIMAPTLADDRCYRVGAAFEAAYTTANGPLLAQAPELELSR
jgi:aspartyl-tRNA(Asn)/glutamyl-tRNA(Gln) amidotransferase subunit A